MNSMNGGELVTSREIERQRQWRIEDAQKHGAIPPDKYDDYD